MAMARTGPAPLVDERDFIPRDLEEARVLSRALVTSGAASGKAEAGSCVMWLVHLRDRDGRLQTKAESVQASRYRKVLARLGTPPWGREPSEGKGASLRSSDLFRHRRRLRPSSGRGPGHVRPGALNDLDIAA